MTDFTAMAREITGPCTCTVDYTQRGREDPTCAWHNYAPEIVDALTLSHAAGRAEGMEEAAKAGEEYANGLDGEKWRGVWDVVKRIRALASSDPAPRDQVAEALRHAPTCPFAMSNGAPPFKCNCGYSDMAPAPAPVDPGLAAQEVERLTAERDEARAELAAANSTIAERDAEDERYVAAEDDMIKLLERCQVAEHCADTLAAENERLKAIQTTAQALANWCRKSLNAGPITNDPSREAKLWRDLRTALAAGEPAR